MDVFSGILVVLCCIVGVVLCCAVMCYAVLCCAVLCCVVLCRIVLCCVVLLCCTDEPIACNAARQDVDKQKEFTSANHEKRILFRR